MSALLAQESVLGLRGMNVIETQLNHFQSKLAFETDSKELIGGIDWWRRDGYPTLSKTIEPIKSTIMEFEKFLHWLTSHLEEHKRTATLGESSTFNAKIGVDGRCLLIEFGSRGKSGQLSYDKLKLVWDRYMSLGNRKNLTSEYTDPSWPETPDRILAPYAAALIRDFGNDFQNRFQ